MRSVYVPQVCKSTGMEPVTWVQSPFYRSGCVVEHAARFENVQLLCCKCMIEGLCSSIESPGVIH